MRPWRSFQDNFNSKLDRKELEPQTNLWNTPLLFNKRYSLTELFSFLNALIG